MRASPGRHRTGRAWLGPVVGICLLAAAAVAPTLAAASPAPAAFIPLETKVPLMAAATLAPAVQAELAQAPASARLTVIVVLRDQANLADLTGRPLGGGQGGAVVRRLRARAAAASPTVEGVLQRRRLAGELREEARYWIFNGLAVSASPAAIQELAALPQVAAVLPNTVVTPLPVTLTASPPEPNLTQIGAPAMWAAGYRGQNVVVANLDTGVDVTHPDLAAQWRGGSNSWYDPYGQHPITPTDVINLAHGTETMGVMVGGEAGGTAIGVAPAAQWIAAKVFSDTGQADAVHIHLAFEWVLDPDHNPATADAPQVVNASWAYPPGCQLDFEPDLAALRAAGIVPVLVAGNYGPTVPTDTSPGNNPSGLPVGAVDGSSVIASFSSRGPTTCGGGAARLFPALVAPGVSIRTTYQNHGYHTVSGTSLAAPHVSGALALLLSAYPFWTVADLQAALLNSAVDLGDAGPDNAYGYGRLDVFAAHAWLMHNAAHHMFYFPILAP